MFFTCDVGLSPPATTNSPLKINVLEDDLVTFQEFACLRGPSFIFEVE